MNAPMSFGAKAYAQVGLETGVNSASPHRLIVMLYDGAIQAIRLARLHTEGKNPKEKAVALDKAIRIIDEGLCGALDMESGGELSKQLLSLYQFVTGELFMANVKNDVTKMDDCIALLDDLRSAWVEIGQGGGGAPGEPKVSIKESL